MQGKKPTLAQRKLIKSKRLNAENWLVQKDTSTFMQIVHKYSDNVKIIKKVV